MKPCPGRELKERGGRRGAGTGDTDVAAEYKGLGPMLWTRQLREISIWINCFPSLAMKCRETMYLCED
jgi:hypothetical protein